MTAPDITSHAATKAPAPMPSLAQLNHANRRILILGAECTGKSTLAQDLAKHFNTRWVGEYMRDYLQDKPADYLCQYDDLLPIAIGQMHSENTQAKYAQRFLFCDTGLFEIMAYAQWYFGRCPDEIITAVRAQHYDLVLLTDNDSIVWQDDGLRDLPDGHDAMRAHFMQLLNNFGWVYHPISGNRHARIKAVSALLEQLPKT